MWGECAGRWRHCSQSEARALLFGTRAPQIPKEKPKPKEGEEEARLALPRQAAHHAKNKNKTAGRMISF